MLKKQLKLLLCTVAIIVMCSCSAQNAELNQLITKLETACEEMNSKELTDCIDPQLLKSVDSLFSMFGSDTESATDLISSLLGSDELKNLGVLYDDTKEEITNAARSFKIKPLSYEYNEDKTRCTVEVEYSLELNGEKESWVAYLHCVERDGKWYITYR